jgi:azurin
MAVVTRETGMWRKIGVLAGVLAFGVSCSTKMTSPQGAGTVQKPSSASVKLHKLDDRIRVELGGELFTEYVYKGENHSYLYPLIGPDGVTLNRSYPINDQVLGEEHDHPHHTSLWLGHGDVNGYDFWHKEQKKGNKNRPVGKIEAEKLLVAESGPEGRVKIRSAWKTGSGEVLLKDITEIKFSGDSQKRIIDYTVTLFAQQQDVVFGDNKEGFMAARLHPALRLQGEVARGSIINSEGVTDKQAWGKRARWVSYSAPFSSENNSSEKNEVYGVTVMDHPSNHGYPTTYHARGYGLLAANPFGLSAFEKKPAGTGDFKIKKGGSATFRYRWVLHKGDAKLAGIESIQKAFSAKTPTVADRTFNIGVVPGALKFDFKSFDVRAGEILQLNFKSNGIMPHNFVLTGKGKADAVLKAAQNLGSDGVKFDYLPDTKDLIIGTRVLKPDEQQSLLIAVPDKPGQYPYLCSFPGHGFVMRGVMNVRKGRQAMYPPVREGAEIIEVKDALSQTDVTAFPKGSLDRPLVIHTYMPRLKLGDEVFAHHDKAYPANRYSPSKGGDVPGVVDTLKGIPASITVNLGERLSYTWDTLEGRLLYAWTGGFLDMSEYWGTAQGGNRKPFGYLPKIIGPMVYKTSGKHPLSIQGQSEQITYLGYQLEKGIPTFLYKMGEQEIRERIVPAGKGQFIHQYQLPGNTSPVKVSGVSVVGVSEAKKQSNVWMIGGESASAFTVTIKQSPVGSKS